MPVVKNQKPTVVVVPDAENHKSTRFMPYEEKKVDRITDEMRQAEEQGILLIDFKRRTGPAAENGSADKPAAPAPKEKEAKK